MLSWDTQTPLPRSDLIIMIVIIIVIIINIMIMIIIIFTISPILLPRSHMKYNAVIIDTMVMIAMQRYGDW